MKSFFILLFASLTFLVGLFLGTKTTSYSNNISQEEKTFDANENSHVEYASETNEKFYLKMVEMERNSTLTFSGFPTCLTSILHYHTKPGDVILNTEKDTLYLVDWDLNRTDINKYPYYVIKDNNKNLWFLFRHNEQFLLTRKDETKYTIN